VPLTDGAPQGIHTLFFADDTKLSKSVKTRDLLNVTKVHNCLAEISNWM